MTTSKDVAQAFEKEHKHVLRDIDCLVMCGGPDLDHLMFQEVSAHDPAANRETRSVILT